MTESNDLDLGLDEDDDLDASPEEGGPRGIGEVIDEALVTAVGYFVEQGTIEMSPLRLEHLLDDLHKATLKAVDFEDAIVRVIEALVESKHVEEVFGTDEELATVLRQAFKLAAEGGE